MSLFYLMDYSPAITGLNPVWSKSQFLMLLGVNCTFFPQHFLGVAGKYLAVTRVITQPVIISLMSFLVEALIASFVMLVGFYLLFEGFFAQQS